MNAKGEKFRRLYDRRAKNHETTENLKKIGDSLIIRKSWKKIDDSTRPFAQGREVLRMRLRGRCLVISERLRSSDMCLFLGRCCAVSSACNLGRLQTASETKRTIHRSSRLYPRAALRQDKTTQRDASVAIASEMKMDEHSGSRAA